jgi:glycosyltransferase involved in cell wall biosynthesis
MNICMFSRIMPTHAPGGMQDHVQTLSQGLVKRGHRVTVLTTARGDQVEFENIGGVAIHFLKGTPVARNSASYWRASASKFQELHTHTPFDILHSQSVGAYGVYRKNLHRKFALPLVTSLHGTHMDVLTTSWHSDFALTNPIGMARFFALSASLLYRYWRDLPFFQASDIMIATSDADPAKYKKLYHIPDRHIRKVYNGIDIDLFSPRPADHALRDSLSVDDHDKIILALARLEKDKGVQNAIAAMPRVLQEIRASLIVVGDGDYRSDLERLARSLRLSDHVRFVGALPLAECAGYLNLCDLFVDPTLRTDGYDLTIAEAMACGKPVIASDVGANSTLIDAATRTEGLLIPRGDNNALAREIVSVLSDPAVAQAIGKNARAKIGTCFSVDAMAEGMERVYVEVEGNYER